MKTVEMDVVYCVEDGVVYIYNNVEEMLAVHNKIMYFDHNTKQFQEREMTEEEKSVIISEKYPWFVTPTTIKINIDGDKVALAEPLMFYDGK